MEAPVRDKGPVMTCMSEDISTSLYPYPEPLHFSTGVRDRCTKWGESASCCSCRPGLLCSRCAHLLPGCAPSNASTA
ncbi:hypothetical protein HaLaN_06796, partial [Haematococcus lacustris]